MTYVKDPRLIPSPLDVTLDEMSDAYVGRRRRLPMSCYGVGTNDVPSPDVVPGSSQTLPGAPAHPVTEFVMSVPWWVWAGGAVALGYFAFRRNGFLRNPDEPRMSQMDTIQWAASIATQAGLPVIVWGPPGIGKTSWIEDLSNTMAPLNRGKKVHVETVIGSTRDPADIGGIMDVRGNLIAPGWARRMRERSEEQEMSILFLDEFSSMSPLVHAALLRVVRDRIAGELELDPLDGRCKGQCVRVIAAANRPEHGAAAIDLPAPAANRLIHLDWPKPDALEFARGLIYGLWTRRQMPILPMDWRQSSEVRKAKQDVANFLIAMRGGDAILSVPADEEGQGGPWPSPRSWETAAYALGAARLVDAPLSVQEALVRGSVGEGMQIPFFDWIEHESLPDPEQLLALRDVRSWDPPEDPDAIYVISNALAVAVKADPTPERWEKAVDLIDHMARQRKAVDITAVAIGDLMKMRGREIPVTAKLKGKLEPFLPYLHAAGLMKVSKAEIEKAQKLVEKLKGEREKYLGLREKLRQQREAKKAAKAGEEGED